MVVRVAQDDDSIRDETILSLGVPAPGRPGAVELVAVDLDDEPSASREFPHKVGPPQESVGRVEEPVLQLVGRHPGIDALQSRETLQD